MSSHVAGEYTLAQLQAESARIHHGFALIELAIAFSENFGKVYPEMAADLALHGAQLKKALRLLRDLSPEASDEQNRAH